LFIEEGILCQKDQNIGIYRVSNPFSGLGLAGIVYPFKLLAGNFVLTIFGGYTWQ
jgi:hypothetical protein